MKYFAYGMNMANETMLDLFGGFGHKLTCLGAAVLYDHLLEFRYFADITPAVGQVVQGRLWELDDKTLQYLDYREGYPVGYDRKTAQVQRVETGELLDALVYFMQPETRAQMGQTKPAEHYLGWMREGRQQVGLDTNDLALVMP